METGSRILFRVLASLCFVYYPTAFLTGLSIWLLQQFLLHERLFRVSMARGTISPSKKLPGRKEFLRRLDRPLLALLYVSFIGIALLRVLLIQMQQYDCIICRDQPTDPVQMPCQHTFCRNCIMEWINRGHRRCPLCTKVLFTSARIRAFEESVKLFVPAHLFAVPLEVFRLYRGSHGWIELFL